MLVLGWDPGIRNCAWAVYNASRNELVYTGVEEGIGEDIKYLPFFSKRITALFDHYKPDYCGIERYQLRQGKGFVGNMEKVNIMIGVIAGICHTRSIPVILITPVTHKVYAKRHWQAKKDKNGKISTKLCPLWKHLSTEHEADAANVAKYVADKVIV